MLLSTVGWKTYFYIHTIAETLKCSNYYEQNHISKMDNDHIPECLHMSIDERLVHGVGHSPGPLELADEFVVHRAPVMIDQLDLLVGAVVSEAVVDHNVKAV